MTISALSKGDKESVDSAEPTTSMLLFSLLITHAAPPSTLMLQSKSLRGLATTGLVFVSFGGLNKVVNVAEEVEHPDRNLPFGILLACVVVTIFYIAVVSVTLNIR